MTTGLNDILTKLTSVKDIGLSGVIQGIMLIKAEAQKITPVDTTNLIGGAYTDNNTTGDVITGEVGYKADYAPYVHEMPAGTNWKKPSAENKFLEKALTRNEKAVMTLIQQSVEQGMK